MTRSFPGFYEGFKDGIEWTSGDRKYRRTTCLSCNEKFGTCQGLPRFLELKRLHRGDCAPPVCGFRDCADCVDHARW